MDRIQKIQSILGTDFAYLRDDTPGYGDKTPKSPGVPFGHMNKDSYAADLPGRLPRDSSVEGADETPWWVHNIYNAVKEGKLNIDEFAELVQYHLETVELREKIAEDGLTADESHLLKERIENYKSLFEHYRKHEEYPEPDQRDPERLKQIDRIYKGILSGEINLDEAGYLLKEQVKFSECLGYYQQSITEAGEEIGEGENNQLDFLIQDLNNMLFLLEKRDYRW